MNATTRTNTQACEICMFVTSDEPIYYLCKKIGDCNFFFFSSSSSSPFISCDFECGFVFVFLFRLFCAVVFAIVCCCCCCFLFVFFVCLFCAVFAIVWGVLVFF